MAALKGIEDSTGAIARAIRDTNLEEKKKCRIRSLSGGQRQRVGIAQAILGDPSFLIFDEPTVGLNPEERINFRNLFSRIAQDKIVLLSTHIIEDVQSVCNQLIVIDKGRILFTGAPARLIQAAQGHVGVFEEADRREEEGFSVTARVNTSCGVSCRVVAVSAPPLCPAGGTHFGRRLYVLCGARGDSMSRFSLFRVEFSRLLRSPSCWLSTALTSLGLLGGFLIRGLPPWPACTLPSSCVPPPW